MATATGLSEREVEVLRTLMEERTEREIAARMGLSLSTIHTYVRRTYRKLGAKSKVGAVVRIIVQRDRLRAAGRSTHAQSAARLNRPAQTAPTNRL